VIRAAETGTMALNRLADTGGHLGQDEGRQPWMFFTLLFVVPLILVILITAFDVSLYLESWVSSLLD
jgi:hypothetical protein